MSFAHILDSIGGMGRFQRMSVAFLAMPLLMLASHNLLQNFTAGIPDHHCQVRITANYTRHGNATRHLRTDHLLRIAIPTDENRQPEKCRRFVTTQWQLLDPNTTVANTTAADTEPCIDGWTYDQGTFANTIISEVRETELCLKGGGYIQLSILCCETCQVHGKQH